MSHRRQAPDTDRDGITDSSSDSVDESPHEEQPYRIRGLKCRNDVSVLNLIPVKDFLQVRSEQPKHLAIHVIDRGRKKEQGTDDPAKIAGGGRMHGCLNSGRSWRARGLFRLR